MKGFEFATCLYLSVMDLSLFVQQLSVGKGLNFERWLHTDAQVLAAVEKNTFAKHNTFLIELNNSVTHADFSFALSSN